jgi:predicted alpha/beta-hydrolase family hydrolase
LVWWYVLPVPSDSIGRAESNGVCGSPVSESSRLVALAEPANITLDQWEAGLELLTTWLPRPARNGSLVADEASVAGLVCLGYQFHPAGKPETLRVEHLRILKTPTLIVQSERDAFGSQGEVATFDLSPAIRFHWLLDSDHRFKPRKSSGRPEHQTWEEGVGAISQFDICLRRGAS